MGSTRCVTVRLGSKRSKKEAIEEASSVPMKLQSAVVFGSVGGWLSGVWIEGSKGLDLAEPIVLFYATHTSTVRQFAEVAHGQALAALTK